MNVLDRLAGLRGNRTASATRLQEDPTLTGLIADSEGIEKLLYSAARPISTLPQLDDLIDSFGFLGLEKRLLMSGKFGQSARVFMAVQVAAAAIGCGIAFVAALGVIPPLPLALVAFGVAAYPYNILSKAAKAREVAVTKHLPVFADQMQMPLLAGLPIVGAMQFVAERSPGPVSDEVRNLLVVLRSRSVREDEAFLASGYRLGTPDALQFMTALLQAHVGGSRVTEQLQAKSRQLRIRDFQRRLAEVKKFPVKLVGAMFMHLVPLLFIIVLVPSVIQLLNGF